MGWPGHIHFDASEPCDDAGGDLYRDDHGCQRLHLDGIRRSASGRECTTDHGHRWHGDLCGNEYHVASDDQRVSDLVVDGSCRLGLYLDGAKSGSDGSG